MHSSVSVSLSIQSANQTINEPNTHSIGQSHHEDSNDCDIIIVYNNTQALRWWVVGWVGGAT